MKNEMTKAKLEAQAVERFEWLVNFLIIRFRFVHQILGMMTKAPDYSIETMGVWVTPTGRFRLGYNPDWVMSLRDPSATYVFYHEVLHLVLLHCTKRKLPDTYMLGKVSLANIATDLAVNELIPINTGSCEPPKDEEGNLTGTHVSEFQKLDMFKDIKEKQTAEWYYDFLVKKLKKKKEKGGGGKGKESKLGKSFDSHDGWKEHEVATERVSAKVREINSLDTWGTISATTKEMILAAQIKKINWRNLIRVWFGNQATKDKRYTRKKPNRRTGFIHPGTKRNLVDRWLVAADTSGSIDSELLAEWIGVLNQLVEEIPIDFMQFDWEKTEEPTPFDKRRLSLEFKGRGGTNFQPVIDIVEQRRYKGVMILTDGEAAEPTRPRMARVLWVLPEGKNPPVEWGHRIHMQKYV